MYKMLLPLLIVLILSTIACAGVDDSSAQESQQDEPVNHWLFSKSSSRTSINTADFLLACIDLSGLPMRYRFDIITSEPLAPGRGDIVPATTIVSGQEIDVTWDSWFLDDRDSAGVSFQGEDVLTFVDTLDEDDETITVEFIGKPEHSGTFNLSGLLAMIEDNNVDCFEK